MKYAINTNKDSIFGDIFILNKKTGKYSVRISVMKGYGNNAFSKNVSLVQISFHSPIEVRNFIKTPAHGTHIKNTNLMPKLIGCLKCKKLNRIK